MEKEDVVDGGDWTLAANLPDDFGQNCFCTTFYGAASRQHTNCNRPLSLEEKGKHPHPALKSGLAGLVPVVWSQPCFVPAFADDAAEW